MQPYRLLANTNCIGFARGHPGNHTARHIFGTSIRAARRILHLQTTTAPSPDMVECESRLPPVPNVTGSVS